jgi:signal transduction histidine kinase
MPISVHVLIIVTGLGDPLLIVRSMVHVAIMNRQDMDIVARLTKSKGTPPARELLDVNQVAREMVMLLRREADRHGVSVRTELASELPKVRADRVQLQQVFMNLMLNAIEAMEETAGELTIQSQPDQHGELLISVSDTGVGLPVEKAAQAFL